MIQTEGEYLEQGAFPFAFLRGCPMNQYMYDGPVMEFDTCVANRWQGSTYAASEKKARSNLVYQFKKKTNRIPSTRITLPGKVVTVN